MVFLWALVKVFPEGCHTPAGLMSVTAASFAFLDVLLPQLFMKVIS